MQKSAEPKQPKTTVGALNIWWVFLSLLFNRKWKALMATVLKTQHPTASSQPPSKPASEAPRTVSCHTISEAAIGAFVSSVAGRLRQTGETIDADGLEAAMHAFTASSPHLSRLFEEASAACRAGFERSRHAHKRRDSFGRLIVQPFASLLDDHFSAPGEPPRLSRAMISPFFGALHLMLGEEFLSDRHRRCDAVMAEIQAHHGIDFDWEVFHADKRMRVVLANTLFEIAGSFENFERRMDWFIGIVNQGLDGTPFTRAHFAAMMMALFGYIRDHRLRPAGNDQLKALTESFLVNLEALQRDVLES